MEYRQASAVSTILGVQDFIARHADRLGTIVVSGAKRQLDEIGARLEVHAREQAEYRVTAHLLTRKRTELRRTLINEHMYPISQVARATIASYSAMTSLHMPRLNINDEGLILKARALASTAGNYSDSIRPGLNDDNFVASLRQAAEALDEVLRERAACIALQEKATAALKINYCNARLRLRVLDRFVTAAVRNDPALLIEWNFTKRISRKRVAAGSADAPDTPTQGFEIPA